MNDTNDKIFLSRIYPIVETSLKSLDNSSKLFRHFQSTIGSDRLMSALESAHPGGTVYFGDKETSTDQIPIYTILRLSHTDIRKAIKDTNIIQSNWQHLNKPLYWVMMMIIRYEILKKDEEKAKMAVAFLTVAMYASIQFKYFRRFYQANVMAYAINTLTDKFTLKQEGTIFKACLAITWRSHLKYISEIKNGSDEELKTYLVSMWGRLNGMIKALKNHYESVRSSGNYINQSREKYDDDTHVERDTDSSRVQNLVDKVTTSFFGEAVPSRLIEIAGKITDTPFQSLMLAINDIRNSEVTQIRQCIHYIIELYYDEGKASQDDIKTRNFLAFSFSVYTRSNTSDDRIEKMKGILNKLLLEHSPQYFKTNREATKGAFRKALFAVLVLFIQSKA